MASLKLARGKKKTPPSRTGAVGCVLAIILLLLLFFWMFSAALRPN
jgi:hypothetical protein